MAAFTAFYDANVLYPAELRNLLMHLALTGLFRAKWSADVHEARAKGAARTTTVTQKHIAPRTVLCVFLKIDLLSLKEATRPHAGQAATYTHANGQARCRCARDWL